MIIDAGAHWHRYTCLHPLFDRGFRFLAETDLRALAPGRHAVDADRIYLSIDQTHGRGRDAARLESHRRYVDIQYTIEGDEEIGWMPLAECGQPVRGYDDARDAAFYAVRPSSWFAVPAGTFVVFFPEDAHAPLAGRGRVKKAILKIAA